MTTTNKNKCDDCTCEKEVEALTKQVADLETAVSTVGKKVQEHIDLYNNHIKKLHG